MTALAVSGIFSGSGDPESCSAAVSMQDVKYKGPLLLLAGRANQPLSQEIGEHLGASPWGAEVRNFSDGEIVVRIEKNARGRDVFIIQPTTTPGDNIL